MDAVILEMFLHLCEERSTDTFPAMLFRNVECNNVSERGIGLGKDKSGQLFSSFRDKAVRSRKIQEVLQRKFAVGNPWRETHLIKPVEGTEVTGLILPNRYGHRCGQCYHGLCAFPSSNPSLEGSWPFSIRGPAVLDPLSGSLTSLP